MALLALTDEQWLGLAAIVVPAASSIAIAAIQTASVRRQTTPLERRRTRKRATRERAEAGGLSHEVEGYIVRWLIFTLTAALWGAVLNIVVPWLNFSGRSVSVVFSLIYAAIFGFLGLPLLIDVYRRYGFQGRRRGRA